MNAYLFAGYSVIWVLLFLYLLFMHRRQQRLNRELKGLAKALEEFKGS